MLTKENNELLTRVEGDAPMGRMLQDWYWVPAVRAARLEADGAPLRVRLFGRKFVAFRATDGRVGFLDEACPHRGASLAIARNEGCGLRCIFHGIKIDVSGRVSEVPCEPEQGDRLAAKMKVNMYPVRETGGIVWVYLGTRELPPEFPDLEFTGLTGDNIVVASSVLDCNWVQGLEATLDSSHVAILHQSFIGRMKAQAQLAALAAPSYEVERSNYGLKAVAIRALPDGRNYVRVSNFVMPWFGLTSPNDSESGDRAALIAVPIDDTHTLQWFIRFNTRGPTDKGFAVGATNYDLDNFTPLIGGEENNWGQNRQAMKEGHFTGFDYSHHLVEDMVVQVSMGPVVDRSKEFLLPSDLAVVQLRRVMLGAVEDFMAGKRPCGAGPDVDFPSIRSNAAVLEPGKAWQEVL